MEDRDNMGCNCNERLHGCGDKMQPYPESNPDYVLSRASQFFGSGYVECTNVASSDLPLLGSKRGLI
jgi:hypothetical protein